MIIGGGIVGCSTAYHLTRLGWRDLVLIDQGPLFQNWGSTSHAPGLIFQHNNSQTVCQLARWTIETYREVAPHARQPAFFPVGSLEIAATAARARELKRKLGNALAWGLEAALIDNDAIRRLSPLMRTDDLHGAFHVPSDANVNAAALCEAMAGYCRSRGTLSIHEHTPVSGFGRAHGRVNAVHTPRGTIQADLVLCAAGLWGPEVGRLAGVPIPLLPMQHLYARTAPLPELRGETQILRHPIIRDQDHDMYYRQHGEAYGFGSYGHDPLPVNLADIPKRDGATIFPFTPEHMASAQRAAEHRMPCLRSAPIAHSFNGVFSFTADAQSLLGEWPELRGFWIAEAVWVTHGGGVGRAMAQWLSHGNPGLDLREVDVNRIAPHARSPRFVRERSCRQYIEVYDIIHPLEQPTVARNLRLSPFHARQRELQAHCFEVAGWERPQWYESNRALLSAAEAPARDDWTGRNWSPVIAAEHRACRERVALVDVSALAKIEVAGPGALALLERLAAADMNKPVGKVIYTTFLNAQGGIQTDVAVIRRAEDRFWVVTGARQVGLDVAWMKRNLRESEAVQLTDLSSAYCGVAVWGPRARELLASVCEDDVSHAAFPFLTARDLVVAQVPVVAVRVSYVGELGWELYAPTEFGLALWDGLWAAGRRFGAAAVGHGAVDSLRLEKGFRAWGSDIHTEHNPLEAGLGFAVSRTKADFIGQAALAAVGDRPARRLCCLVLADPKVALMGKEPVFDGDRVVGHVTSANYGYTVGQSIAYAYLPSERAAVGTKLEIYFFGQRHAATVSAEPLYDPKHAKLRS
ncbi:MAG: GcvT family protein [Opitutaceae bacterium]|nr:GcvT family protein [Opitutaceae bacterium]